MLELAICCINIMSGNTSDTPASAGAPRRPTKCASMLAVTAIRMTLTTRLGGASRSRVAAIGPSSSSRVRGLIVVVPPDGGAVVVPRGRASLGCAVCEMANAMGVSHLDQGRTTLVGMRRLTGWLSGNPGTKSRTQIRQTSSISRRACSRLTPMSRSRITPMSRNNRSSSSASAWRCRLRSRASRRRAALSSTGRSLAECGNGSLLARQFNRKARYVRRQIPDAPRAASPITLRCVVFIYRCIMSRVKMKHMYLIMRNSKAGTRNDALRPRCRIPYLHGFRTGRGSCPYIGA